MSFIYDAYSMGELPSQIRLFWKQCRKPSSRDKIPKLDSLVLTQKYCPADILIFYEHVFLHVSFVVGVSSAKECTIVPTQHISYGPYGFTPDKGNLGDEVNFVSVVFTLLSPTVAQYHSIWNLDVLLTLS